MNIPKTVLVLAAAFLAVFLEAAWDGPRRWLGAQVDLLPALMVYASLHTGLAGLTILAIAGGLCFDSLSANPLGLTILPLFLVGFAIHHFGHLILQDELFAQWVLGLAASALVPVLALLLLTTLGRNPLVGMGSVWQWLVMSLGGATLTPLCFKCFAWIEGALSYRPVGGSSFRDDREIKRGKT
jgi:rod shape-determining protein MreD